VTGGQNVIDENDDHFVGAGGHTAGDAETTALIWAHVWLLQSGVRLPATFHFDAKVVGMGATGDWNIDPKNHQLLDRLNWSSSN